MIDIAEQEARGEKERRKFGTMRIVTPREVGYTWFKFQVEVLDLVGYG